MQTTTETYRRLIALPTHWFETRVIVKDGSTQVGIIQESGIVSLRTESKLFSEDNSSVGCCVASEVELQCIKPSFDIPYAARLEVEIRIHGIENNAESVDTVWLKQGIFFVDTRTTDSITSVMTLHGYDAMLRAEAMYPADADSYPMSASNMVNKIASYIGVTVDSRNTFTPSYNFPLPATYTMREVLQMIAASYGGNFIITDVGKLRLVGLSDIPPETRFLIDNAGYSITFGGDRILV